METLDYRSAFITGASSGLGHGLTWWFSARGVKVYAAARRLSQLEELAEQCRREGGQVEPVALDVSDSERTRWRDEGWWWPVVFAALGLAFLLLLWWLLAQLRRRRLGEVLVDSGDVAGVLLRGRALEEVLAAETEHLPGVDRVHVRVEGGSETVEASIRSEP